VTPATLHRFGPCLLDEARRSLTAHGRELRLQPRVFDLLCYLVRHRDRVVGKDELLDALWPGTVVVDNALQRVVSLARGALAQAGLPDAVRTYSRHGYRFCVDGDCVDAPSQTPQAALATPDLAAAQEALALLDWPTACAAFAAAEAHTPLPADAVEQWGRAAICAGLGPSVVPALERVVAERDAAGDALAAARATLLLVQIRIDHRQGAIANGLLQRASRWLAGRQAGVEQGHCAWMASRLALGGGRADEALARAEEACAIGRQLPDADVECLGLVYRGHALAALGEGAAALVDHEEAAAVVRLGGVRSWVAGWALCSILYAARHRCDWSRAAQFAQAFTEWSRASRMPAFPGTCQLHCAAVLGVQGDLERAAGEVTAAVELIARASPWAEGDAHAVLGDILFSMGELERAEASYRRAHALGWDPQPGLARLQLATGRAEQARRELERALDENDWTLRERRGQILCLLAQAAVAAGHLERAKEALQALEADPQIVRTEALQAQRCAAEADLAMAEGDAALAVRRLRQGVRHWRELGCPTGEAELRLRLAECLWQDRDPGAAELELQTVQSRLAAAVGPHRRRLETLASALRTAA
jgi:DNA-binding winged helix-turn-helix (wHTH) protein